MERFVEQSLLYDFYGELLNEHQRRVYEDVVFNDLTLSEAASEYNISRQGVSDMLKRINNSLKKYEDKLHLVEKFEDTKDKVREISDIADAMVQKQGSSDEIEKIRHLAKEIIEEF